MAQQSLMNNFRELFHKNALISISGEAGTGKTSLSLYLVGNFLTSTTPYEGSCIWVQASELFPKKRVESLFKEQPKKLDYIINNTFITPRTGMFGTYDRQLEGLHQLSNNFLPPDVQFIVIDNISHHLRYKLSRISDVKVRADIINKFYDLVVSPLIFRCYREKITLILIHEVSYNLESQQNYPFFSKLYRRLKGLDISLSKSLFTERRTMKLASNNKEVSFTFDIAENGFRFFH